MKPNRSLEPRFMALVFLTLACVILSVPVGVNR